MEFLFIAHRGLLPQIFRSVGLLETGLLNAVLSILLVAGNNLEYGKATEKREKRQLT